MARQLAKRPSNSKARNELGMPFSCAAVKVFSPQFPQRRADEKLQHQKENGDLRQLQQQMPGSNWLVTSAVATPSSTQPMTSSIAAALTPIAPMAVRSSFISSRIRPMIGSAEMESAMQRNSSKPKRGVSGAKVRAATARWRGRTKQAQ